MQLDELKKLQSDVQESARNFERSIAGEIPGWLSRVLGKPSMPSRPTFSNLAPLFPKHWRRKRLSARGLRCTGDPDSSTPVAKG